MHAIRFSLPLSFSLLAPMRQLESTRILCCLLFLLHFSFSGDPELARAERRDGGTGRAGRGPRSGRQGLGKSAHAPGKGKRTLQRGKGIVMWRGWRIKIWEEQIKLLIS